ncbi:MazG-like family protein [Pectobacterium jejuense]|uniref:MazG-like family protein n=1 Tax=Pectobacterium jejuense TaxID=2974022 RepID=UPI00228055C7|nr:MazG-like family protein [Pectobacterium jejuense]MCY9846605.1 MazG-like family protein [Pectobacterium jejuense]
MIYKHLNTRGLSDVVAEMDRQDIKWGADRDLDPFIWAAILGEEVGEYNQAILHDHYGGKCAGTCREELVQIAAVALQIIEYYDRKSD